MARERFYPKEDRDWEITPKIFSKGFVYELWCFNNHYQNMYISNYSMLAYIAMFKAINEMKFVFFTLNLRQVISKQLMVNNNIA